MSHDMAITETHAVLFDLPLYFDAANIFLKGEFPVQFQRDAPSRIGLIERGGSQVQVSEKNKVKKKEASNSEEYRRDGSSLRDFEWRRRGAV